MVVELFVNSEQWTVNSCWYRDHLGLPIAVYCFQLVLRPFFGKSLASNPSRKIPTRIAISVISTVVFVIQFPVLSTRDRRHRAVHSAVG